MKKPNRWMETALCGAARGQASVMDDCLLAVLARSSALAIVDRHARDVRSPEALVEAITRVVLLGLEAHVRLWEQSREEPK
jgi:hypothetical protein